MINASIAIQILPQTADHSKAELIRIVDEVIALIAASGMKYMVGAFETTVEGDFDKLMDLAKACHLCAVKAGAQSVSAYIKTNYVPTGNILTIAEKTDKYAGM